VSAGRHITHWIGGKPWDGVAARQGDVYDPATGLVTGKVDFAEVADVDAAVAAATDAFASWRRASLSKRASVLFAFRELARARAGEIAAEHCNPASDQRGPVEYKRHLVSELTARVLRVAVRRALGLAP